MYCTEPREATLVLCLIIRVVVSEPRTTWTYLFLQELNQLVASGIHLKSEVVCSSGTYLLRLGRLVGIATLTRRGTFPAQPLENPPRVPIPSAVGHPSY